MMTKDTIANTWKKLNRRFVGLCITMVLVLFAAQFATLAMLGTRGTEVSRIRIQQQELRLENETLRAEIDSAKTLELIEAGVESFNLRSTRVNPIDVTEKSLQDLRSVSLAE